MTVAMCGEDSPEMNMSSNDENGAATEVVDLEGYSHPRPTCLPHRRHFDDALPAPPP